MAEYIDRDEIRLKTCGDCTRHVDLACQHPEPCEELLAAFLNAEPENVAPVVHGEWIQTPYCFMGKRCYECSRCYSDQFWNKYRITEKYPQCPNCGAKMVGGAV